MLKLLSKIANFQFLSLCAAFDRKNLHFQFHSFYEMGGVSKNLICHSGERLLKYFRQMEVLFAFANMANG